MARLALRQHEIKIDSMKNFIPENNRLKRLMTICCIMFLLVITGCETDPWADFAPLTAAGIPKISEHASQQAQSEPLILREGDMLHIVFPGSSSLDTTQQIRRDGKIVMPLVGEVTAAGKTPEDLQSELIKLYEPQVATKQIIVTLQSSSYPIFVTGAVLRPGEIQADHPMTALEAVMEAGGFDTTKANSKAVIVIRQEKTGTKKFTLNLKEMMKGTEGKPFYLQPSDIVNVPEKFQWF